MSFHDIMKPSGGMPVQRVIDQPTPEQHLLERIPTRENMESAWKRVKANKGAPGVDSITIEQFPDHTRSHWSNIRASLATGTYQPKPVLRVEIPKPTGSTRPLGIPTVLGWGISAYPKSTTIFPRLTAGYGAGCGCATGNSGGGAAPRFVTC